MNTKAPLSQYLFQMPFDSPLAFEKNLYFNFEGIDFKLLKGTKKYQDVLCCIIEFESGSGPDFKKAVRSAENIALKFLSCLAWEFKVGIRPGRPGGGGWTIDRGTLSAVKRRLCNLEPRNMTNWRVRAIHHLPKIDNQDKAIALSLFREAKASTSVYYEFLCYWKILEIHPKGVKKQKQTTWIDETLKNNKWVLSLAHFDQKKQENTSIGEYLYKECRHAIAHVIPKKAGYKLPLDSPESLSKIYTATRIVEELARIFIQTELGLRPIKRGDNRLYLRHIKGRRIPAFVEHSGI